VMFVAVMLAIDSPINVAVAPADTVSVNVDGLPDVPRLGVTFDLNAISYPRAIAIATALLSDSVVLGTSRFVLAVAVLETSPRFCVFSILSEFRLMKLLSTSVFVRGLPLAVSPVSRVTMVAMTLS
jgi:hypothetical protein